MVLPGQLFAFYRWGGTVDPILPALTERPVAVRQIVPLTPTCTRSTCCGRPTRSSSSDAAVPGQLPPLLRLHRACAGRDRQRTTTSRAQRRAWPPDAAARVLAEQGGCAAADARLRPGARLLAARPEQLGAAAALPRCAATTCRRRRGLVRVEPPAHRTVVDGSRGRLAASRRSGRSPRRGRCSTPADLTAAELRARRGGRRGRRQRLATAGGCSSPSRLRAERRLDAGRRREAVSEDAAMLDPFGGRGTDGQTVAVYERRALDPRPVLARRARSSPSTGRSPRSTATRAPRGSPTRR